MKVFIRTLSMDGEHGVIDPWIIVWSMDLRILSMDGYIHGSGVSLTLPAPYKTSNLCLNLQFL